MTNIHSQTADVPLNNSLYNLADRLEISGRLDTLLYSDSKPYAFSYSALLLAQGLSKTKDKKEKEWIKLEQGLWDDSLACAGKPKPILKAFYKNKRDLYQYRGKDLEIYVNPVFYFSGGGDHNDYTGIAANQLTYRNSRGLTVRGTAFGRLGFYTEVEDNQAKYPEFIRRYNDSLPAVAGEGFYKVFEGRGYDFFSARGYLTYSPFTKMRIKFGKDRLFLGNGYQSLLLSDNSTDYIFLNVTTRIWKLEYVNHFTQMVDLVPGKPDTYGAHPRKYAVFHQLSIRPTKNTSFSVFESVVYATTNPGSRRGFEVEYLNPIIFYRSVEQFIGSPDNAFIGFQGKYNFLKRFQAYGQILIDDFNWRMRTQGNGWWGNKYGLQAGLKWIDAFFVKRMDLQIELNQVRPYTYQHFNPSSSYTHYRQYLGHSMGANFRDLTAILRYQPLPRLSLTGIISYVKKGLDLNGLNYGGDPFQTNLTHFQQFNNLQDQGRPLSLLSLSGRASWQLFRLNAWAEIEGRLRKENEYMTLCAMGTLRMNIAYKPVKF